MRVEASSRAFKKYGERAYQVKRRLATLLARNGWAFVAARGVDSVVRAPEGVPDDRAGVVDAEVHNDAAVERLALAVELRGTGTAYQQWEDEHGFDVRWSDGVLTVSVGWPAWEVVVTQRDGQLIWERRDAVEFGAVPMASLSTDDLAASRALTLEPVRLAVQALGRRGISGCGLRCPRR